MIFNDKQKAKANFILSNQYAKLSDLIKQELKGLAIVWSYYSGKIEGNTYSYVETECLLKDGITSEKRYEDAKMLKNLYNTFISELHYIHELKNTEIIDEKTLLRLHSTISSELVSTEESGRFRDRRVRITGTDYVPPENRIDIQIAISKMLSLYVPPENRIDIQIAISKMLSLQDSISDPLEKAVFLHCNIAKIQPFIDENKRTSRMVESIVMMNNGIIPVYSTKEADINRYKSAILQFYETGDYTLYADYFLDKQIHRINDLSRGTDIKFDLETNKEIKPSPAQSKKMRR